MTRPKGSRNKPKEVISDLTGTAPRLPYPPDIAQRFGFDALQWKVLVEAILPEAKTAHAVIRVLSYCKTCADANRTQHEPPSNISIDRDEPVSEPDEEVRDGAPPQRDIGLTVPDAAPRVVPWKGKHCETWAEQYTDMLRTSNTTREFQLWRSLNAEPLEDLTKRKPSLAASVRKVSEQVLQALTDEEDERVARLARIAEKETTA